MPSFTISFPYVVLDEHDIWPDGNAPENPTVQDVIAQMKGSAVQVARDWNLIDELEVDGEVYR